MQEEVNRLWDTCLSQLSKVVKKQSFYTWLRSTKVEPVDNESFNILVPNRFAAKWIEDKYGRLISEAISELSDKPWKYDFQIRKSPVQTEMFLPDENNGDEIAVPAHPSTAKLNQRYRFSNYVVGDSNQFAYAACEAVAQQPGERKYNPLFIYGGVGLGKTHLVHAIGNHIADSGNNHKILYATSEQFTNEFIRALGNKSTEAFVNRYRFVDFLLLDDIQFFTGKESTQEQFFHTFNALYQNGKQIILTADRPPRDIRGLEERLLSRFSWGLIADIQPPSLETRIAILQKKATDDGVTVPLDILSYIANSITSNVRELEGALVRLVAYSSLSRKELTLSLAQDILKDHVRSNTKQVSIEQIQKKVANYFRVSEEMLKAKKKSQEIVSARQVAMYLCRTLTQNSLKSIGISFGNRDHSTVIHACQQVTENIKGSIDYKLQIDRIINSLYC